MYDAVFFGRVNGDAEEVLKQGDDLCRRNASKQMNNALNEGIYARESSMELFAPNIQDFPEL